MDFDVRFGTTSRKPDKSRVVIGTGICSVSEYAQLLNGTLLSAIFFTLRQYLITQELYYVSFSTKEKSSSFVITRQRQDNDKTNVYYNFVSQEAGLVKHTVI